MESAVSATFGPWNPPPGHRELHAPLPPRLNAGRVARSPGPQQTVVTTEVPQMQAQLPTQSTEAAGISRSPGSDKRNRGVVSILSFMVVCMCGICIKRRGKVSNRRQKGVYKKRSQLFERTTRQMQGGGNLLWEATEGGGRIYPGRVPKPPDGARRPLQSSPQTVVAQDCLPPSF